MRTLRLEAYPCVLGILVAGLLGLAFPHSLWAQAALENPQPGSFQSGIGVISGWVCEASQVQIVFDDTVTLQAAYGTSRQDTLSACGDADNGFGLLFNWNLLGDGRHTVRVLADGQEFATAPFTIASFGTEFLTGVSGEFPLGSFPPGETAVFILWQESVQNFVIRGATENAGGNSGMSPRVLENPQPGSFQSGIGVISGWVCEASRVEIIFNDTTTLQAAYGTSRQDTLSACGDADNGFGLLFNWNLLGDGRHTVRVLADGQEFANATVTVTTLGGEFLQGVGTSERIENFPQAGTDSIVAWQASIQNFIIARIDETSSQVRSMDAAGDSITKAFNAQSEAPCPNSDQEFLNWSTSVTHGGLFCSDGGEGVFSQAERLACRQEAPIVRADPNSAVSGAQMLKDFAQQANAAAAFLGTQPAPHYVTVSLGHNDICAGRMEKVGPSCEEGSDQDAGNYCRTTPEAFEREFRKGLDVLISVPQLKGGVASLSRVSQLCNYSEKQACSILGTGSCQNLWTAAALSGSSSFGLEHGICASLTVDCSEERIRDAYEFARIYHDILARVTAEYSELTPGERSSVITIGGQSVGGAVKAVGVTLTFSDAPWVYKFSSDQISCCDCFHPSILGQDTTARILFDGFTCSPTDVCCADAGDALTNALCTAEDTSGTFFSGL